MIQTLYNYVLKQKSKNKKKWPILYKICKVVLNLFYPILAWGRKKPGTDADGKIIVSLTSFPDRIGDVWISISTIMNQTLKPARIVLWLSEEQFPDPGKLPESLKRLQKRGLEIKYCEDLMPHKKYFYTMQENPDQVVVTIDDDIFYPEDHLEKLWAVHQQYPRAVCCWYGHVISYREDGSIEVYNSWISDVSGYRTPSLQLVPVGCGGVLYPPGVLPGQLFCTEDIKTLCLKTDDLWLKAMEVLGDVRAVRCVEDSMIFYGLIKTRHKGLFAENADRDGNDVALRAILGKYPQVEKRLYEDYKNRSAEE